MPLYCHRLVRLPNFTTNLLRFFNTSLRFLYLSITTAVLICYYSCICILQTVTLVLLQKLDNVQFLWDAGPWYGAPKVMIKVGIWLIGFTLLRFDVLFNVNVNFKYYSFLSFIIWLLLFSADALHLEALISKIRDLMIAFMGFWSVGVIQKCWKYWNIHLILSHG